MDRVPPLRSTVKPRRAGVLATILVATVLTLSSLLFGAGVAAAQGWVPGVASDGEQPVSLARAGADSATPNWIDGGPVVPLLLILTAGMLIGGGALLVGRCRSAADA
jgi:hypothetical protein